jgi:hypothetical protein
MRAIGTFRTAAVSAWPTQLTRPLREGSPHADRRTKASRCLGTMPRENAFPMYLIFVAPVRPGAGRG